MLTILFSFCFLSGSCTMNVCEFKKLSVWGYDKFILSTDLVSPARRLVEDDSLKIHCRVWIEGDLKHKVCNGGAAKRSLPEDEKAKRRKDRLATDFGKIFRESILTDIAISTEKQTFMAHKAVLAGLLRFYLNFLKLVCLICVCA